MTLRKSSIGKMEESLYTALNGCYVVATQYDNKRLFDLRGRNGEYIGDGLYRKIVDAKGGADRGGDKLYVRRYGVA